MDSIDSASFEALGLDPRLVRALLKQKIMTPTAVQTKGVPLALAGKVCHLAPPGLACLCLAEV